MRNGRDEAVEKYTNRSRSLILQAQEELDKGDSPQASEKAWGAAAQAVKAIAELRGWEHRTHAHLFRNLTLISTEIGEPGLLALFREASSLHQNFYEDAQTVESVQGGIDHVSRLIDTLLPLAPSSPAR